jgi:hypothetical protein
VVPSGGIEPPYHVPQTCVLTIELKRVGCRSGNRTPRPLAYETSELPLLHPASLKCTNVYFFLLVINL